MNQLISIVGNNRLISYINESTEGTQVYCKMDLLLRSISWVTECLSIGRYVVYPFEEELDLR